jgi:hypothetical protein
MEFLPHSQHLSNERHAAPESLAPNPAPCRLPPPASLPPVEVEVDATVGMPADVEILCAVLGHGNLLKSRWEDCIPFINNDNLALWNKIIEFQE